MADTLEECDQIIAAVENAGVHLLVAHSQRYFAATVRARELLQGGELGQPVFATDTWYKPFGLEGRLPWFRERATGGGMWLMNGAHMIDRTCWVLDTSVESVQAWIGSPFHGLSADDANLAFLHLRNGLRAVIAHTGYRDRGVRQCEVEVACTGGMLRFDSYSNQLATDCDGSYVPIEVQEIDPFAEELKNLVGAIGGREALRHTHVGTAHPGSAAGGGGVVAHRARSEYRGSFAVTLEAFESTAVQLARTAGERALAAFRNTVALEFKGKKKDNPVTVLDRDTETFLRTELRSAFPEHGLLGEEHADDIAADARYVWVIDPIDGTMNFASGLPLFGISVGLLEDGAPVAGCIWVPVGPTLGAGVYHARLGGGAYFDDTPMRVSKAEDERGQIMALPGVFSGRSDSKDQTSRCRASSARCPILEPPVRVRPS